MHTVVIARTKFIGIVTSCCHFLFQTLLYCIMVSQNVLVFCPISEDNGSHARMSATGLLSCAPTWRCCLLPSRSACSVRRTCTTCHYTSTRDVRAVSAGAGTSSRTCCCLFGGRICVGFQWTASFATTAVVHVGGGRRHGRQERQSLRALLLCNVSGVRRVLVLQSSLWTYCVLFGQ